MEKINESLASGIPYISPRLEVFGAISHNLLTTFSVDGNLEDFTDASYNESLW